MKGGQKESDNSIVEISVKLASIYAMQNKDEAAEIGFKFCMDTMNQKAKEEGGILGAETNTLALQGLCAQGTRDERSLFFIVGQSGYRYQVLP